MCSVLSMITESLVVLFVTILKEIPKIVTVLRVESLTFLENFWQLLMIQD